MTLRANRPSDLQTLKIPTIVIHHAEPTPGLTPRTPYSLDPNDETVDQYADDLHIKVHLSPSAPITPVQPRMPRMPRNKPNVRSVQTNRPQPKAQPNRGWRVATWSALLALLIMALLSLHNVNFNSQPSTPPSAYKGKPMEWITITPQKHSAAPMGYPTQTPAAMYRENAQKSSQTLSGRDRAF